MPRRKTITLAPGEIVVGDAPICADMQSVECAIGACRATRTLHGEGRGSFKWATVLALGHLRGGKHYAPDGSVVTNRPLPWLSGKRTKPFAKALDLFMCEMLDVWESAGLRPTVRADNKGVSEFLQFCKAVLVGAGFKPPATLLNNAKRARNFKKRHRAE